MGTISLFVNDRGKKYIQLLKKRSFQPLYKMIYLGSFLHFFQLLALILDAIRLKNYCAGDRLPTFSNEFQAQLSPKP